jgi:hypothetical protein
MSETTNEATNEATSEATNEATSEATNEATNEAVHTIETITFGPLAAFFSNKNTEMNLKGHSHYAEVTLTYKTLGSLGFPVFHDTVEVIHERLRWLTERPFTDSTNEDVARAIFNTFYDFSHPTLHEWGGDYQLVAIELAVRGVRDKIGHSDGFARYRIEKV